MPTWQWWIGVFVIGIVVLLATDRVSRRLLPLAALYKLSLAFPDEAPNRFSVAMRTGTTRQVQRRIEEFKQNGIVDDETTYAEAMLELVASLSVHDRMTRGHCERVRAYTDMLIEELKISDEDAGKLRWAALLHDVGKLHVPTHILNKDGRPTDGEWKVLKSHTWKGDEMIEPLREWLGEWADTVGSHHERWDGDGYPNGLAGTDIALGARIVAVADAFDVMTSTRSYKKPIKAEDARAEVARCAGTQFDPKVVRAFLNIGIGRLRFAIGPLSWAANVPAAGQTPIGPALSPVAAFATATITAAIGTVTGGFFGLLTPDAEDAPADIAFAGEESPTTTTTLAEPTTTTIEVTTTTTEATTTTIATRTQSGVSTTQRPTTTVSAGQPTTTAAPATTTTTAPPAAPVALAAAVSTNEDSATPIVLQGIGSGALSFSLSSPPGAGSVTLTAAVQGTARVVGGALPVQTSQLQDRTAVYVPQPNFHGTDRFSFTVCETASPFRCATSDVTVDVVSVNDVPVAGAPITLQIPEGSTTGALDGAVLAAASDADGDPLTIVWGTPSVGGTSTATASGLTYAAPTDFGGVVTYPYEICDGTTCVPGTLTIVVTPVNDAPVVTPMTVASTEDTPLTIVTADLLASSISDVDDADITLTVSYSVVGGGGTLDTSVAGQVTLIPTADYNGPVTVEVTVCDPTGVCTSEFITVNVAAVNDAPVADDFTIAGTEDTTLSLTTTQLFPRAADVEDADSALTWTFTPTPDATFTNVTTNSIDIKPLPNAITDITVDYSVCDLDAACDTGTITITVASVNDKPVANNFVLNGAEDALVAIDTTTLQANASDADHSDALLSWTFTAPTGTLVAPTTTSVSYQPPANATGDVFVEYTVCDPLAGCDNGTITITLSPVNDEPVANNIAIGGTEDTLVQITDTDLYPNATDIEDPDTNLTWTFTAPTGTLSNPTTNSVDYQPAPNVNGDVTINYTVCDTETACDNGVITITLAPANDTPVPQPFTITGTEDTLVVFDNATLTANVADIDNPDTDLTFTPSAATGTLVNVTPTSFSYQPAPNVNGNVQIGYRVCDPLGACADETITITLAPVNDEPVADNFAISGTEDTLVNITATDLYPNATDIEDPDTNLTWTFTAPTGTLSNATTNSVDYQPAPNVNGDVTINYTVCDTETACDNGVITISLASDNDLPVAQNFTIPSQEDTLVEITTVDLYPNAADADHLDTDLTWTFTAPTGTLSNATANSVDYQPVADSTTDATINYTVCDPEAGCGNGAITITLSPVNDAPVAQAFTVNGTEDTLVRFDTATLLANASDVDHPDTDLTFTPSALSGTLLNVTPTSFDYQPALNVHGDVLIGLTVCDPEAACVAETITVSLASVVEPPTIGAIPAQVLVAGLPITPVPLTIADPDHALADLTITHNLPSGLDVDTTTYEIVGTPDAIHKGVTGSYTIDVEDPDEATASVTVAIEFEALAVSPLAGKIALTEINYAQIESANLSTVGVHDEFIEITNLSGEAIDVTGLILQDFDPTVGVRDTETIFGAVADTSFDWAFPAADDRGPTAIHDGTSILGPGDTAVVFLGDPDRVGYTANRVVGGITISVNFNLAPFPHAPGEAREYVGIAPPWPTFDNNGDDVWLLDANGDIVDFVAWDDGNGNSELSGVPAPYLEQWGAGDMSALVDVANGQSISLSTAVAGDDASCWAQTTSPADATCADAVLTIDNDAFSYDPPGPAAPIQRVTSIGQPNFN